MVDIDPYGQIQQLTPRGASIVDAVADAKRVIDAAVRTNPLTNARVDTGLMVWRGNYAGTGGIFDSYLWIGEVGPNDVFLNKPQRGFFVTRDDPRHAPAFWMYDWNPQPTGLRQTIGISDSDNRPLLRESRNGGAEFPYGQVALYQASLVLIGGVPIMSPAFPINASARLLWIGYGPMTGSKLKMWLSALSFPAGVGAFDMYAKVYWDGDDGGSFTGPSFHVNDNTNTSVFWDFDFGGQGKVGREVHVEIWAIRSGTSGTWNYGYVMPMLCYSYA